jgi:hypothetical protein
MKTDTRKTIINSLAVVGFVTLLGAGIGLAAYATRFVPMAAERISAAAVYLGSVFSQASSSELLVGPIIPTLSILSNEESPTAPTTATTTTVAPVQRVPVAGTGTSTTSPMQVAAPSALSGLPDLFVNIDAIGYLATSSAESFVASSTVPSGNRPAIRFTIKNIGTNVSGVWRFNATIPTDTAYLYESQLQQSLYPGDRIEYTLGFDQAHKGAQTISVTANFDRVVHESNRDNNSASAKVTIF